MSRPNYNYYAFGMKFTAWQVVLGTTLVVACGAAAVRLAWLILMYMVELLFGGPMFVYWVIGPVIGLIVLEELKFDQHEEESRD